MLGADGTCRNEKAAVQREDDFVVVCKTRQEAEAALALADRFLRETLGISLHPEKTRIVHVDHGFEFLGYKVKRGPGLWLPAYKRKTVTNRHNLYAVPREKSVQRRLPAARDPASSAAKSQPIPRLRP